MQRQIREHRSYLQGARPRVLGEDGNLYDVDLATTPSPPAVPSPSPPRPDTPSTPPNSVSTETMLRQQREYLERARQTQIRGEDGNWYDTDFNQPQPSSSTAQPPPASASPLRTESPPPLPTAQNSRLFERLRQLHDEQVRRELEEEFGPEQPF